MRTVTLDQALASGYGTWRSFTCPSHDDSNPSARVNVTTGKWVCMVCHAHGDIKGYVADPNMILEQAMALLNEPDLTKPESWLDQFDSGPVPQYWLSRFSEATCRMYRLGWDGTKGQPCYPLRGHNGLPIGVVHRNIDDPGGPKYKYPRGAKTSELLFGSYEAIQTDYLVLVEGATTAMAVREAGHDAIGTYGARLYARQAEEIRAMQPRRVLIAYDMDGAGHTGAKEARRMLTDMGILTHRMLWNDRWNDLDEMDPATRSSTIEKALAFSPTYG